MVTFLVLFPILVMLGTSLKPISQASSYPPVLIPAHPQPSNYAEAWRISPLGRFALNSVIVASVITLGKTITSALAALAFARMRFWGRDILFFIFLATLMVPEEVLLIPNFLTISRLGWLDTYWALVMPFLGSATGTFLLRQFFLTIPGELEDAAKIDGCGPLRFLTTVLLPLSRPALGAFGIFSFLYAWNMYLWPLVVTRRTAMRTIQVGVAGFLSPRGENPAVAMAAITMVVAPTVIAFLLAQKHFVKGISMTGLKG
ncbi:MAG: carbohydrate ABC transporter permease [Deinococcus sp.]|nr:carbohydrate ABC transporter permease [Deinococcus sp.]